MLKVAFILSSLAFCIAIIFLLLKTTWLDYLLFLNWKNFFTHKPAGNKQSVKQWDRIEKRLASKKESEYKVSVIEADSMLEDVFQKMGLKGDTMEEKLKQITPDALPDLDQVIYAHDVRNNVAHDPDYQLSLDQAKRTLGIYKKALEDLEVF